MSIRRRARRIAGRARVPSIADHRRARAWRAWPWLLAAALLLRAAVPLIATAAAQRQGLTLAEVCSVYGVRMVAVDAGHGVQGDEQGAAVAHAGCALAFLAGTAPSPDEPALPRRACVARAAPPTLADREPPPPDAQRRWLAARMHEPPRA